jgi:hypothetical protein
MSENSGSDILDPLKAWRDWFVQNERTWSDEITKVMKQDNVAETFGREINAALFRQQMLTQGIGASLSMLNLPTRDDIVALGERLGMLEDSVARQEAALTQLRNSLLTQQTPRTRSTTALGTTQPSGGPAANPE